MSAPEPSPGPMPWRKCRKCSRGYPDSKRNCPHCDEPNPTYSED